MCASASSRRSQTPTRRAPSATGWPTSCATSACAPARSRPICAARTRAPPTSTRSCAPRRCATPGAFLAWLGVAHAQAARTRRASALPAAPRGRRARVPGLAARAPGRVAAPRARHLRARRHRPGIRDPRPRAASAARGSGGHRAAPARRRGARLALRTAGALAVGPATALLATRGRRGRARPRRHARRRYLASAGQGEQCAGAFERALLVGELALERSSLGRPRATADACLGEALLDFGHALLVLAQRDRERAHGRLGRLLRRARAPSAISPRSRRPAPALRLRGGAVGARRATARAPGRGRRGRPARAPRRRRARRCPPPSTPPSGAPARARRRPRRTAR